MIDSLPQGVFPVTQGMILCKPGAGSGGLASALGQGKTEDGEEGDTRAQVRCFQGLGRGLFQRKNGLRISMADSISHIKGNSSAGEGGGVPFSVHAASACQGHSFQLAPRPQLGRRTTKQFLLRLGQSLPALEASNIGPVQVPVLRQIPLTSATCLQPQHDPSSSLLPTIRMNLTECIVA